MVSLNSELNLWQVSDIDLLLVYGHWPWLSWDAIWRTVLDIRLNPEVFSLTWVYLNKPTQFVQPCPKQRIRQLSLFCNAYYLFRFRIRVKLAWEDFSKEKSIISRQVHVFFCPWSALVTLSLCLTAVEFSWIQGCIIGISTLGIFYTSLDSTYGLSWWAGFCVRPASPVSIMDMSFVSISSHWAATQESVAVC